MQGLIVSYLPSIPSPRNTLSFFLKFGRFDGILFSCARTILPRPNFGIRGKARRYWVS